MPTREKFVTVCMISFASVHLNSYSSGLEVRPINDLFQPYDFIRLMVSLSSSHRSTIKESFGVANVFHPTHMIYHSPFRSAIN